MIQNVMQAITGIEVFPIIGLLIFFAFFTGVIFWTVRLDNNHVQKMANLPLEPDYLCTKQGEIRNDG